MRNIKLLIEYEGTHYSGWQRQEDSPTIQGEIERALKIILREETGIIGAGRTDAGVHAKGQVANFRSGTPLQCADIKHGLNGLLPEDIVIREAEEVAIDFHSRFSARERLYTYTITRDPVALLRNCTWHLNYDLHIDVMRWAAAAILGAHDFSSFCKTASEVDHHRCTVNAATWESDGTLLRFTIRADRFLHGMVRALVGTMVDVGRNYTPLEEFVSLLEQGDRSKAGMAAPAKGLVLDGVFY